MHTKLILDVKTELGKLKRKVREGFQLKILRRDLKDIDDSEPRTPLVMSMAGVTVKRPLPEGLKVSSFSYGSKISDIAWTETREILKIQ